MSRVPRPAPNRYSPSAAALASFSSATTRPQRSCSMRPSGTSFQPCRLGGSASTPRAASSGPAAETPMPASVPSSVPACLQARRSDSSISSATASGPRRARVAMRSAASTRPSAAITAVSTFVPPRSIAPASVSLTRRPLRAGCSGCSTAAPGTGGHGRPRCLLVQPHVLLRSSPPGVVLGHGSLHQPAPLVGPSEHGERPLKRLFELVCVCLVEYEAVAHTVCVGPLIHRIGQAAGAPHDRHRAVAQRDHLAQAAGLEARGHEEQVRAAVDLLREIRIEGERDRDAQRVLFLQGQQLVVVLPIARA